MIQANSMGFSGLFLCLIQDIRVAGQICVYHKILRFDPLPTLGYALMLHTQKIGIFEAQLNNRHSNNLVAGFHQLDL